MYRDNSGLVHKVPRVETMIRVAPRATVADGLPLAASVQPGSKKPPYSGKEAAAFCEAEQVERYAAKLVWCNATRAGWLNESSNT